MKTIFLQDRPAKTDSFGVHARIADSIARMIDNGKEGKAISIMGTWGSGKSTIVNLLTDKFSTDKKTVFFIYDAWEHLKDPIRRSYIEEFHDFLVKKNIIEKEQFEDDMIRLTHNSEKSTTRTTPKVNKNSRRLILMLYLVPLGLLLLKSGLDNQQQFIIFPAWENMKITLDLFFFYLGLIMVLAPFVYTLACMCKNIDIFNVFTKTFSRKNMSKTIRTTEPTALEFKDIYGKLLHFATYNHTKIIAVIDNLDRVNREEVLNLWSTMQTLFEVGKSDPIISKKFWLIVPFDSNTPKRVWDCEQKSCELGSDKNIGKRFVNKTFQVVVKVPKLRLTSWKDFFLKNMKIAFPDNTEKEYYQTFKLYELLDIKTKETTYSPTPREIIIFINKVGAFHNMWSREIPLPIIALYVICEDEISTPEKDIKGDKLFGSSRGNIEQIIEGGEWHKYFAALYFGVSIEEALHVLMSGEVERLLVNGERDKIENLSEIPGIDDILVNFIDNFEYTSSEQGAMNHLVSTLDAYKFKNPNAQQHTWEIVCHKFLNGIVYKLFSFDEVDTIELLLKNCTNSSRLLVTMTLANGITDLFATDNTEFDKNSDVFIRLATVFNNNGFINDFANNLKFHTSHSYVYYIGSLADHTPDELGILLIMPPENIDIHEDLSGRLLKGSVDKYTSRCCTFLVEKNAVDQGKLFASLAEAFSQEKLEELAPLAINQNMILLLELALNFNNDHADEILHKLTNDGTTLEFLDLEKHKMITFQTAILITLLYLEDPSIDYSKPEQNSGIKFFRLLLEDPEYEDKLNVNTLYKMVKEFNCFQMFLGRLKEKQYSEIVSYCVREFDTIGDNDDLYNEYAFIELHESFKKVFDPDYIPFVKKYLGSHNVIQAVAETEIINCCQLYHTIFDTVSESIACINRMAHYLSEISAADWRAQAMNRGLCYLLALKLYKHFPNGFMGDKFLTKLKEMVILSKSESPLTSHIFINLFMLLDEEHFGQFVDYVFEQFEGQHQNEAMLTFLEPLFINKRFTDNYSEEYVLHILIPLLSVDDYYGVGHVYAFAKDNKEFLKPLKRGTKTKFKNTVIENHQTKTANTKGGLKRLADVMKIKFKSKGKKNKSKK
ncbi:P-loop NTPase fold protein [Pseudodesulfovibrio indicus]|uniref:P-loop NTPase fold protein n=1 Tax=Pseudodesulfovibrio indicus TaxID=1716143 RepID=UPI00292E3B98|nr:P-loop NTPase fold protein [Pseudodesulfovibrio indicus]